MIPLEGMFLLVSWGICWYFFLAVYAHGPFVAARPSRAFARTTYGVAGFLLIWTALMWSISPHAWSWQAFAGGAALTVLGQWLMCVARQGLPLSNYDVVMRIAAEKTQQGVYRFVAHPMYLGLLLALTGSSLVAGNTAALVFLVPVAAVLMVRTYVEARA